jgi:hypothetical protein
MSADIFEPYRDRREAGQYLGRELQRTLPALLHEYQQQQQQKEQQQLQEQQQQRQQEQQNSHHVHHDSTSTSAATGSLQLDDFVVLGLVRGGMPVADAVAHVLHCPCDAFVVRKIGAPLQPE